MRSRITGGRGLRGSSRWWVLLAVLALTAGACDPAASEQVAATPSPSATDASDVALPEGATLRWAVREPAGIVPSSVVDDTATVIVDTLFDSLTDVSEDGTVRPSAAVTWEPLDDGRRWRFVLRDGAVYHDGTPVTADDFVTSWTMTVDQGRTGPHLQDVVGYRALRAGRSSRLAGVRAVDDRTLDVRLKRHFENTLRG